MSSAKYIQETLHVMGVPNIPEPDDGTRCVNVEIPMDWFDRIKNWKEMELEELRRLVPKLFQGLRDAEDKDNKTFNTLAVFGAIVASEIRRLNGDKYEDEDEEYEDEDESDEDDEEEDEDEECILCNSTNTIPGPCGPICEDCLAEHGLVCKACEREARDRGLIEDKDEEAKNPAGVRCLKWNGTTWE